ncbi:helix-turn-helix protein [Chitinophaga japonensis]|uniref:Helix-turn-helix protein n=2 Tax=Chitinophaga japonensis TaxID=104662 RepID=A0A562SMR2_CHIJA|nr:helix-turn-helix protein [Chitinophaga japonensis]
MADKKVHQGRNIKRIREILGIKQDALAIELGDDWNQQKISLLEQKEVIDPQILELVAKALHVNPEAIKNFNEEQAINIFSNTFSDFKDNAIASAMNYQCTFNPIDKIVQLYDEKIELYERMLKEKNELLEKLAGEKKK